jgi:hypothetical protein
MSVRRSVRPVREIKNKKKIEIKHAKLIIHHMGTPLSDPETLTFAHRVNLPTHLSVPNLMSIGKGFLFCTVLKLEVSHKKALWPLPWSHVLAFPVKSHEKYWM